MSANTSEDVRTGLDVFLAEGHPAINGKRVGLITNPTGVDNELRSTVDLLYASDRLRLTALFGPEHGLRGDAQAGAKVASTTDRRTGLPVYSLFGNIRAPTASMLVGLDALIFDIQDIGVRYATYLSTLVAAQGAAAAAGVPIVVFDRPNPLNGSQLDGNMLDLRFTSFVGAYRLPVRHGLTIGEAARLVATGNGWPEPIIVPMRHWRRDAWYDETGLSWVQPSPNLPTVDSVTLYPGTCLIEGTNLSEGRGTTRPFELVGAPWIDPYALGEIMNARQLPGVRFRPAYFAPTFSKHAGEVCGGVQIHITDREILPSVALGIHLLHAVRGLAPDQFTWRLNSNRIPFIDHLLGSDQPRLLLDRGADVETVTTDWPAQLAAFAEFRRPSLLYP